VDPKIPDLHPLALPDNFRERTYHPVHKARGERLVQLKARLNIGREALPFPARREQLPEPASRKTTAEHGWGWRWDIGDISSLGTTYLTKVAQAMMQSDAGDDPPRKFFPQVT
jgi:hypothetical protein